MWLLSRSTSRNSCPSDELEIKDCKGGFCKTLVIYAVSFLSSMKEMADARYEDGVIHRRDFVIFFSYTHIANQ